MSLRFQKFWFRYTCRFGKSSDRRISQQIKHCFKFGSKTIEKCGVERKSHFILHSFLSNISSKYTVNHAFISWSSKVETVKGFLHKCYVQKMKRVEIMEAYWNKIVDLTDWNILMASNSGNIKSQKLKKIRECELTKLDKVSTEQKMAIIKEYLR